MPAPRKGPQRAANGKWRARWYDSTGTQREKYFATQREARSHEDAMRATQGPHPADLGGYLTLTMLYALEHALDEEVAVSEKIRRCKAIQAEWTPAQLEIYERWASVAQEMLSLTIARDSAERTEEDGIVLLNRTVRECLDRGLITSEQYKQWESMELVRITHPEIFCRMIQIVEPYVSPNPPRTFATLRTEIALQVAHLDSP